MLERIPEITRDTGISKEKSIPFAEDKNYTHSSLKYHHLPRLARESEELIDQAVEVRQNDIEVLDKSSKKRFLKTLGLGPCILLCVTKPDEEKVGAIHFDVGSNVTVLTEELMKRLNTKDFEGFEITLVGGIGEMKPSEELHEGIKKFFEDKKVLIGDDQAMGISESDYRGYILEDYVPMLVYQSVIVDKKTGQMLSF